MQVLYIKIYQQVVSIILQAIFDKCIMLSHYIYCDAKYEHCIYSKTSDVKSCQVIQQRWGIMTSSVWLKMRSTGALKAVMWSETVTRPLWDQQNRSWSWSSRSGVVLWNMVFHARRHNDLEGHSNFPSTVVVVSLFWSWNITTVKINSGVYLFKS